MYNMLRCTRVYCHDFEIDVDVAPVCIADLWVQGLFDSVINGVKW